MVLHFHGIVSFTNTKSIIVTVGNEQVLKHTLFASPELSLNTNTYWNRILSKLPEMWNPRYTPTKIVMCEAPSAKITGFSSKPKGNGDHLN